MINNEVLEFSAGIPDITGIIQEVSSENVWCFESRHHGSVADGRVVIDFKNPFDPTLDVQRWIVFKADFKRLLYCWLTGIDGRAGSAPSTVLNKYRIVIRFYREMLRRGYESPRLLTSTRSQEIVSNIIFGGARKLEARSAEFVVRVIKDLYAFRRWLSEGLMTDPVPSSVIHKIISETKAGSQWMAPDEPSALLLLSKAIDVVDSLPALVLPRYFKYIDFVKEGAAQGLANRKAMSSFATSRLKNYFRNEELEAAPIKTYLSGYSLDRPADLAVLIKRIQDACFIVLSYTSGFRVSEIRRLSSQSLVYRRHMSGGEYPYINATRSKRKYSALNNSSTIAVDDNPWVVSSGGVAAINVLKDIALPVKERSGLDNLWACHAGNGLWPLIKLSQKPGVPNGAVFNSRLNKFAKFVGLTSDAGWNYRLHTHMGRKHFARFIAKRDRIGLGALAIQYSHASAVSVDISYAMPDREFYRMIKDELSEAMSGVVSSLVQTDERNIFTVGGEKIKKVVERFRGISITNLESKRLLTSGAMIHPCQWGYCYYEKASSSCQGGVMPNPIERSPEVCAGCRNFIATPEHAVWWREFMEDSNKVLSLAGVPQQLRAVVSKRISMAKEILDVIEEK